jgi:DNA-binding Lrp family transcriptional regulator
MVGGTYDIIAKVELDNEEGLKELISKHIRKIERITGTVTIIIVLQSRSGDISSNCCRC